MCTKKWDISVLPITVLFSPGLRLRYRCTWGTGTAQINDLVGRMVFKTGIQCNCGLAKEIEVRLKDPPLNTIYVRDDESETLDGSTILFAKGNTINGALVRLPENENTPLLTLGVTLHEILHALGCQHSDDPGSIMYSKSNVRPQLLAEKDIENLIKVYG